ncbi:tyrosine-type recombinase/integrase [Clostridium botulinum]|uniref:tyrosine-type recombinase/integrase n=1 Tax=Clostridium botulinum TaxID=1491 RepID=UPI001C9A6E3D|nr:tyrosine-type recombinase/integrase [Clostridium botulinum]MBY6838779.1 tyrosine-type recombinase/integrase [Clostridium botulinum]
MRKKINLPESVLEFNDYLLNIKGKSIKTVNGYNLDLKMFFSFYKLHKEKKSTDDISNVNITKISINDIQKINLDDLYEFINYLVKKKNCANTRNRKIATLKSYFRFLLKKKYIQENIAEDLETAKIPTKEVLVPTDEEVEKIFNSLDGGSKLYIRNKAILTVLAYSGLRAEECSNLKLIDVDMEDKKIIVKNGKGAKDRILFMNDIIYSNLVEYLEKRNNENEYLWINENGKNLKKDMIQRIVKDCVDKAELRDKGYSTHNLRKYFATRLYKISNNNILLTSKALGHSSIEVTQKYLGIKLDDLREIMIKL